MLDALLPTVENVVEGVTVAAVDGTGGCGKTSLVVHWAHRSQDRFPDGTLYANLRGYGPSQALGPSAVLAAFLHALGAPEAQIPVDVKPSGCLLR